MEKALGLRGKKGEKGFTLLEYCAGAAVIIGIVWGAVDSMGTSMKGVFNSIEAWATHRSEMITAGDTTTATGSGSQS